VDAFDKVRMAARDLALAAGDFKNQGVTIQLYESLRKAIDEAAADVVDRLKEPLIVNLPLVTPPAAADLGRFELSAYHVGITRHEVAAAALDRILARDFDRWDCMPSVAVHAKEAALEAWAYANSLFEVEHTTEEQPS
jgi:hypothetical protein